MGGVAGCGLGWGAGRLGASARASADGSLAWAWVKQLRGPVVEGQSKVRRF